MLLIFSFPDYLTVIWLDSTVFLWLWQDQDGSHIKGLLINFIHHNWPSLLRHNFLEEFITPIIKVRSPTKSVTLKPNGIWGVVDMLFYFGKTEEKEALVGFVLFQFV